MEKVLSFIKPGNCWKTILCELYARLRQNNCFISETFVFKFNDETVNNFYKHVQDKDFFIDMKNYLKSSEILGMILEGENVAEIARKIIGETKYWEEGTLRKKYGICTTKNVLHCSRKEDSENEIDFAKKYLMK